MPLVVRTVTVSDPRGLHTRPSAAIASTAAGFSCSIIFRYMGRSACASSVLSLMMLAATRGAEIEITAEGDDAARAVESISRILRETVRGEHKCR
jgi:phosphocarrier protein HPr